MTTFNKFGVAIGGFNLGWGVVCLVHQHWLEATFNLIIAAVVLSIALKKKKRWITNVRDGRFEGNGPVQVGRGDSMCVTCGMKMPGCWDTGCCQCGATSCYADSYEIEGNWYCHSCRLKRAIKSANERVGR